MSQASRSSGGKVRRSVKKDSSILFKDGFNWDKYLQMCNLPAAPLHCFTQNQTEDITNHFKVSNKLEAQDPRNPTSICLATVVALQGPRILIRLDGGDDCNDFWRLVDSEDIYPLGTHESKGILLQPPLGFTKNMSTWSSFLAKTREKGVKAGEECFLSKPTPPESNMFNIGMKLEAVDRKNPYLICPATVGDTKLDQVFISFDGWRGAMDYWCDYTSRDLFPVGWCEENDHPLSSPGNKGDNPVVVEKLKILAENAKRKTRSVAQNVSETEKNTSKSIDMPILPLKYESFSQSKASRNRQRIRIARSNHPLIKSGKITEKSAENFIQPRTQQHDPSSVTESSHGSESADSSVSSDDSTDSSEENQDEDSEIDDKKPHGATLSLDDKKYKLELAKSRKRHASAGDEDDFVVNKPKQIRKHSISPHDSSRMVGFGNSNPGSRDNANSNIQSPSFIDNKDSPTSLFGFCRDQIVKKATEGWPSRLMVSKGVVTSDNKLARFGTQNIADSSIEDDKEVADALVMAKNRPVKHEECETPDSMSSEKISSHTVSSTTNIVQDTLESDTTSEISRNSDTPVQFGQITLPSDLSLRRSRSRNPQRWTVGDVIDYVRDNEPALASMVHLFQVHEIDGQALLLINSSIAVKYMSMKLGPALKLASLVERVKGLVPTSRGSRQ